MRYSEREISKEDLEKFLTILDSDEGIRIDDELDHIFINKASKRYCINMSTTSEEKVIYKNNVEEAMSFLKDHTSHSAKIFSY